MNPTKPLTTARSLWAQSNFFERMVVLFALLAGGMILVVVEFVALFLFSLEGVVMVNSVFLSIVCATITVKLFPIERLRELSPNYDRYLVSVLCLVIVIGILLEVAGIVVGRWFATSASGWLLALLVFRRR